MADAEENLKSTGEVGKMDTEEAGSSSQMRFEIKKWNAVSREIYDCDL